MSLAFNATCDLASAAASWATVTEAASGPERVLGGVDLDPAQPAGVEEHHRASAPEGHPEALPCRLGAVRRVEQLLHRGGPVHDEAAGHAEPQAERRALVEVQHEQLPPPPHAGHDRTLQQRDHRRGGRPALHEPLVGRLRSFDPPAHDGRRGAPVVLDLGELWHRAAGTVSARTPGPQTCHSSRPAIPKFLSSTALVGTKARKPVPGESSGPPGAKPFRS